mmetsp:Transcript_36117/g.58016  ORF Transcript_36117/g.58016 Transcript_36117/m.58016 type:complete len:229 (+) Transcript_36117:84-770(+)
MIPGILLVVFSWDFGQTLFHIIEHSFVSIKGGVDLHRFSQIFQAFFILLHEDESMRRVHIALRQNRRISTECFVYNIDHLRAGRQHCFECRCVEMVHFLVYHLLIFCKLFSKSLHFRIHLHTKCALALKIEIICDIRTSLFVRHAQRIVRVSNVIDSELLSLLDIKQSDHRSRMRGAVIRQHFTVTQARMIHSGDVWKETRCNVCFLTHNRISVGKIDTEHVLFVTVC